MFIVRNKQRYRCAEQHSRAAGHDANLGFAETAVTARVFAVRREFGYSAAGIQVADAIDI